MYRSKKVERGKTPEEEKSSGNFFLFCFLIIHQLSAFNV
jgi:hypothetical protein